MRAKIIGSVVALLVIAGGVATYFWFPTSSQPTLLLPGTVEIQEVRLSSRVGGRVKSIHVKDGDLVHAGQVLAVLDMPELEAQREQAIRRREAMQHALEKARNGTTPETRAAAAAAIVSAEAKLARVKAKARPEEVEQLEHELLAFQAEMEFSRKEWDRERWLNTKGTTSDSKLESSRTTYARTKALADVTLAKLKLLKAGARCEEIAEADAEVKRAKAQYDLTVAPTRSEELAEWTAKVEELAARIRELDAMLAEASIKAPEACAIEVLAVRPGDVVAPNQPIARVLRADDLWVKAFVPSTKLGLVKVQQSVEVTVDSHPGQRFAGTIVFIANVSEFTPRNVQTVEERANQVFAIKVRVNDPQGVFKSGMAADVHLPLEVSR